MTSVLGIFLFACKPNSFQQQNTLVPQATVKEIMVSVVDPTTNALWAVALDENIPSSDEDWKALENQSIKLIAISSALSLGGSGVDDAVWSTDEKWQGHLRQMSDISNQFLIASREKNYQGLLDAGEVLIEPCSGCHQDFPGSSF